MKELLFVAVVTASAITTARADSLNCRFVGSCSAGQAIWRVAVSGSFAYVTTDSGLVVFDVSVPSEPQRVGQFPAEGGALGVAVAGDYAYFADVVYGFHVIDISDPQQPREVGFCETPICPANDVAIFGSRAFLADGGAWLRVLDISNPQHPWEVAYCEEVMGNACAVSVTGDNAYVADGDTGLRVVDVSDLENIRLVGRYFTSGYAYAHGVVADQGYAYVAYGDSGLIVVDVADPQHPRKAGLCATPGEATSLAITGDYCYVADWNAGLRIMNVSDPQHPVEAGYYNTPGYAQGIAADGKYAYLACSDAGLQIIEFYGAGVEEVRQHTAGSSQPIATIVRGSLPLPEEVGSGRSALGASLLDASGRKVLALRPGANDVRLLAPGVYFVNELEIGDGGRSVRKVVLTR